MERIRCNCRQCGSKLGDFANVWIQVGKSYCTPVVQPSGPIHIQHNGKARLGDPQTLVDGCKLQDVACSTCETVVGLRCLSTPPNHVLEDNQILFRLSSVATLSCRGAKKAEFKIKRTLQLRKPPAGPEEGTPRPDSSAPCSQGPSATPTHSEAIDLSRLQDSIDLNRKDIDRIDVAGFRIVSALDEAVRRVEAETSKLQKSVRDLRKDFGGGHDDIALLKTELKDIRRTAGNGSPSIISRLEAQVLSITEAVPGLRRELEAFSTQSGNDIRHLESQLSQAKQEVGQLQGIVKSNALTVKEHAKELRSLRTDMSTLRDLPNQRPAPQPPERSMGFPNRELDILTDNIARLGNRASQVETLQMQFEILKGRVERMEKEVPSANMTPTHPSNHRKRSHHDVQHFEPNPESDMSPRASPPDASAVKRPKLTKADALDKRTQKRSSKRS